MPVFKSFGRNVSGVDFIVGDIHGSFSILLKGLKKAGFNRRTDRIFCVGDLIDRGPDSNRVLKFLSLPFVHSIMGNHEHDFLVSSVERLRENSQTNHNGMGWISALTDEEIIDIKFAFRKLPIAMEIETDHGLIGLVHADVPDKMNWDTFKFSLKSLDKGIINVALKGRERIKNNDLKGVPGVSKVYVGHTIFFDGPRLYGNVYAIDCGAFFIETDQRKGGLAIARIHDSIRTISVQTGRDCRDRPFPVHYLLEMIHSVRRKSRPFFN